MRRWVSAGTRYLRFAGWGSGAGRLRYERFPNLIWNDVLSMERWSVSARAAMPRGPFPPPRPSRSEEHTSELQSLMRISYAVFCLKKKKNTDKIQKHNNNHKNTRQI